MFQRSSSGYLYEVLEVSRDCTAVEIRQQYRRLALRYHPDKTGGTTTEQFKAIEGAYRTLSDPEQRRLYDVLGRAGMGQLDSIGFPSFLLSIRLLRVLLLFTAAMLGAVLTSVLLACYKVDHNKGTWGWGAVMIPVWVFSPLVVLIAVPAVFTGLRYCHLAALLLGCELLMWIVLAATTTAALSGALQPVSHVIGLWGLWYVIRTLRRAQQLTPSVYAKLHHPGGTEDEAAEDPYSSSTGGGSGAGPAYRPCASPDYWIPVVAMVWEVLCAAALFKLVVAKERAMREETNPAAGRSFWVVLSPLIVYYGSYLCLLVALSCLQGVDESSAAAEAQHRYQAVNNEVGEGSAWRGGRRSDGSQPRRSTCDRVVDALVAMVPQGCVLYMVCMWAYRLECILSHPCDIAKAPSAFMCMIPIILLLGVSTFIPCCMGCMIASVEEALVEEIPGAEGATTYNSTDHTETLLATGEVRRRTADPAVSRNSKTTTQVQIGSVEAID